MPLCAGTVVVGSTMEVLAEPGPKVEDAGEGRVRWFDVIRALETTSFMSHIS